MAASLPRSDQLTFRWWTPADLLFAAELWADPRVTAHIGGPFDASTKLDEQLAFAARHGVQYWPAFTHDGAFAGAAGLRPLEEHPPAVACELGFHLVTRAWGKGLATEAGAAVVALARERGLSWLFAGHHPDNAASARVLGKLGFSFTHHAPYAATGRAHPSYRLELGPLPPTTS